MDDKGDGNGKKPSVFNNRSLIHALEIKMERFEAEQKMLDDRLDMHDSSLKDSIGAIISDAVEAAIAPLLQAMKDLPKPGKDSSATIQGPGIILSQKQVVSGVTVLIAIVALKVLGIDSDTIAGFIVGLFTP